MFLSGKSKKLVRPFSSSAGVYCRGYSAKLQRVLTDFGADKSFSQAAEKVREHYGVEVPSSTTRIKVEKHATQMLSMNEQDVFTSLSKKATCIIGQADGGMVPLVKTQEKSDDLKQDRRKNKTLSWKEGLLFLAREHKAKQAYFQATMGSREEAGKYLAKCTALAGRSEETHLHCLGDGAPWIAEQVEQQFGSDANFLIDFYHLTQYLAGAAQCFHGSDQSNWLEHQKIMLLENKADKVFQVLQEHIDLAGPEHTECPAQKCFGYMDKRRKYLNYKGAKDADLPIGSGEIEGGIRNVIQSRLKLSGAWWLIDNANVMLALKTVRVNGFWEQYWRNQRAPNQQLFAHA